MNVVIQGVEHMTAVATDLLRRLPIGAVRATVVTLSGDLGAGKTALVQAIAKELGVREQVTSPTFIIQRAHTLPGDRGFKRLIHIDAYRLLSAEELEKLGWSEMVADPSNLILLEWPEKVAACIPHDAQKITLTYVDEHTRHLNYD
jgi:tRNA threonylcarbamoyladenosine biosynthesis protein TsaE